jgi:hypothetical protein
VPPLDRAVALEQVDEVAVLSPSSCTSMCGPLDELFEEDVGAAEGGERFALGLLEARRRTRRRLDDAHAAAAAALGRLEDDGIAELRRPFLRLVDVASGSSLPPSTGTPACWAMLRANVLSPSCSSTSTAGRRT